MKPLSKIKSQVIAITYSAIVKQIFRLSKNNSDANQKLLKLGQQIGCRVADQYTQRQTNSFKPQEIVAVFLKGLLKQYMGCQTFIARCQIKYLKGKFVVQIRLVIKQNPLSDFIILNKSTLKQQNGQKLNYHSILIGFINGSLKSMNFNPKTTLYSDGLTVQNRQITSSSSIFQKTQTILDVEMWKEKQQN